MAKKKNLNLPIIIVGTILTLGIIVAVVILIGRSFTIIGDIITGETEDETVAEMVVKEDNHVSMDEIIWDKMDNVIVATPDLNVQLGNEKMRLGNQYFFELTSRDINLQTTVSEQYDYVDSDGLGRAFTYAGMYAYNAQDDYLISGSKEDIGKRFLVILEDGAGFTVLVDRTEADPETKSVSNVKYVYEIDDGYTPEQYPATDGNGNLI